jgi:hypothetical protein
VVRSAVLLTVLAFWLAAGPRQRVPTDLWVVPFNSSRAAEMVLAQSLQGITGRDVPRLWLDRPNTMSEVILAELDREGFRIHRVSSVWDLPDELWASASGFVLYELGTPRSQRQHLSCRAMGRVGGFHFPSCEREDACPSPKLRPLRGMLADARFGRNRGVSALSPHSWSRPRTESPRIARSRPGMSRERIA